MASGENLQSEAANPLDIAAPRYLLVMTATIVPAANAGVKRADPLLRLEDYKHALRYWLNYEHPAADRILLLENSGADLSQLRAIATDENQRRKPVEILSVPGNRIPEGTNYGYTEMQMLDDGLAMSQLRRETTHMVKATGRLTFTNVQGLIRRLPAEYRIAVDSRSRNSKERFSPTQLFLAETEFYNTYLRNLYQRMTADDQRNHYIENLIYDTLIQLPADVRDKVVMRWPVNCDPVGIEGTTGRSYRRASKRIASALRGTARVVAPQFWF